MAMAGLVKLLWAFVRDCCRSHARLKAENAILRLQLNVLRRKASKRPQLSDSDRALFVWLYRLFRVSQTPSRSFALRLSLAGIELVFGPGGGGSLVISVV